MTKNEERKIGIVLQYLQMGASIVISLIYTPFMLRILGQAEYGIYSLAASIIAYLSLLSLGFGSSYLRYYSRYKANDDQISINRLNGLYLIVFSVLGMIAFFAGMIIALNVSAFFNETYSQQQLDTAKVLMLFLAVNLAVSFPQSV